MKRRLLIAMLFALPLSAQDFPKIELFGGYAYNNIEVAGGEALGIGRQHFHGWGAAVTGNLTRAFGLAFHAGGAYGTVDAVPGRTADTDNSIYGFFVGPELSVRREMVRVFVHPMLGSVRVRSKAESPGTSQTESNVAFALGGGIDVGRGVVGGRLVQVDYIRVNSDPGTSNVRVSAGLVLRF